jgi:ethanolamine utilization protein EutN
MQLARVIGNIVATTKDPDLIGLTLLVLQPLSPDREALGSAFVAVDSVGAGAGEEVFFVRGREAALAFLPQQVPTDASVIGICDQWPTAITSTGTAPRIPNLRGRRRA